MATQKIERAGIRAGWRRGTLGHSHRGYPVIQETGSAPIVQVHLLSNRRES